MRLWTLAPIVAAALASVGVAARSASADQSTRITGPHVHENLAVYFVHGANAGGPVPLTLQEALAKGSVQVVETGRVNELQIENTSPEEVFIQAGDIVKGGRQDRVLTVSFLLPPKSGRVPIASFCVEQGRWTARGKEDQFKFSSANEAMPSVAGLLAMAAPTMNADPRGLETTARVGAHRPAGESPEARRIVTNPGDDTADKQRKVWDSVAATQKKLSRGLDAAVAAPQSATSLQLSLENEKLKEARAAYFKALEAGGNKDGDVIGYVVAINGKLVSASIYPSNALFRKMWGKQLAASVTEAIGDKTGASPKPTPPPTPAVAREFLAAAEKGKAQERAIAAGMRQEVRDADKALYSEARSSDGRWVHRSYLAK
jgi:hypothetical protein